MKRLPKISSKAIIQAIVFIVLVGLVAVNARFILENLLSAKGIDEQIVSEANPRLNSRLLQEAVQVFESFSEKDLTSIFPSDTVKDEEVTEPILIEIRNATKIAGAAANLAELLSQQGYQISALSTAPSLQNQTTVFYKAGRVEESKRIKEILENEGWIVGLLSEAEKLPSDFRIILGK